MVVMGQKKRSVREGNGMARYQLRRSTSLSWCSFELVVQFGEGTKGKWVHTSLL